MLHLVGILFPHINDQYTYDKTLRTDGQPIGMSLPAEKQNAM